MKVAVCGEDRVLGYFVQNYLPNVGGGVYILIA